MDINFGLNKQKSGLRDTMWDLIVDCLGAFFVSIGDYFYAKKVKDSLLYKFLNFILKNTKKLKQNK